MTPPPTWMRVIRPFTTHVFNPIARRFANWLPGFGILEYRERAPAANRVALELDRGQLRTTVITRFELLAGAKTARQLKLVGELLAALPCLPLDEPGADAAAEIRRTLARDGVGIGMADSLIAGIVVAHHGVLLTRNRRHFERVPGLPLGRMGRTDGD
jgi:tRNA(fMet)-specific endonuclease VapC